MNALSVPEKIFLKSAPNLWGNAMNSDAGANIGTEMFVIEFCINGESVFGKRIVFQKLIAFFIKSSNSIGILVLFTV